MSQPSTRRCSRCGYILAGSAAGRCPECGHVQAFRERWIEGELHLDGPRAVLPVFGRCLAAAILLTIPWGVKFGMSPALLAQLNIKARPSGLWMEASAGVCVFVASFLFTRPIRAAGASDHGLGSDARLRPFIPLVNLPWLIFSALAVWAIFASNTPATPGTPSDQDMLVRLMAVVAIPAQLTWILVLRHVSAIAEYLRGKGMRRSTATWMWLWGGFMFVMLPALALKAWRSGDTEAWDALGGIVIAMSNVGLGWGMIHAWLLWWGVANALAMAQEHVEREARRAERERDRYRTPD